MLLEESSELLLGLGGRVFRLASPRLVGELAVLLLTLVGTTLRSVVGPVRAMDLTVVCGSLLRTFIVLSLGLLVLGTGLGYSLVGSLVFESFKVLHEFDCRVESLLDRVETLTIHLVLP